MRAGGVDAVGEALSRLQADLEAKGYSFVAHPSADQIPEFLRGHRPDAIAVSAAGETKYYIEIKSSESEGSKIPLHAIDREAAGREGWVYLLIYSPKHLSLSTLLPRAEKSQVSAIINEVRKLQEAGHKRAALLEGWAALEAVARRIYKADVRVAPQALTPMGVVERLAMEGFLNAEEAKQFRILTSVRNAVAHGDLSVVVSDADLERLISKIEEMHSSFE